MAEVKWVKIMTDIFDNRKIRQIECLPEGNGIIVIWFKILCLAGNVNDNGLVYFTKDIPYTDQMLASQFNCPIALIQLALETFKQFGMVEIVNDVLQVSNWEKYQNVDRLNELREYNRLAKQKSRQKQKLLGNVNDKSMTSQLCQGTDIDIEIDIDKYNIICPNSDDLDVSEQLSLEGKLTDSNVIEVNISETIERIYKAFPRKEGKAKGFEYAIAFLKGRKIAGLGTVKYNHEQLYCAVRQYSFECEDNHTEERYIKLFSTFMNKPVCDYVEKSTEGYESYMERTYGNEWRNIKFTYR